MPGKNTDEVSEDTSHALETYADQAEDFSILTQSREETGLTPLQEGEQLDMLIGTAGSDAQARAEIDKFVNPDRQAEAIAGFGDKTSAAALLLAPEVVVAAILESLDDELIEAALLMRAWANNLQVRDDWDDVLAVEINGVTVLQLLVATILMNNATYRSPSHREAQFQEIPGDLFDEVGVNPAEGREVLWDMVSDGTLPDLNAESIAHAREELGTKFQAADDRVESLKSQADTEAADVAADDEFDLD